MAYQDTIERIKKIKWCESCGQSVPKKFYNPNEFMLFKRVRSWEAAETHYSDNHWVRIQAYPVNGLYNNLQFYHKEELSVYNDIIDKLNAVVDSEIEPELVKIQQAHGLSKDFIGSVRRDIVGMVIEEHFKKYVPTPFYQKIIDLYEAGHLPCGWDGEKPLVGTLIVF
jgi:hypothetical protein